MAEDLCTVRLSTPRHRRQHYPFFAAPSMPFDFYGRLTTMEKTPPSTPAASLHLIPSPPRTPKPRLSPSFDTANGSLLPQYFQIAEIMASPRTPSAGPARRSHRKDESRVKRPPNPFILFAADFRKKNKGPSNRELSIQAGELWKTLPKAEKDYWKQKAAEAKAEHAEAHPGYRYQPRRPDKSKLARLKDKGKAVEQVDEERPGPVLPPSPISVPRKSQAGPSRTARRRVKLDSPDHDRAIVQASTSTSESPEALTSKHQLYPAEDFAAAPSNPARQLVCFHQSALRGHCANRPFVKDSFAHASDPRCPRQPISFPRCRPSSCTTRQASCAVVRPGGQPGALFALLCMHIVDRYAFISVCSLGGSSSELRRDSITLGF